MSRKPRSWEEELDRMLAKELRISYKKLKRDEEARLAHERERKHRAYYQEGGKEIELANREALQLEALTHYSTRKIPTCLKCGFTGIYALNIHKVAASNLDTRTELVTRHGGSQFHHWLKNQGWPSGYRDFCTGCLNVMVGRSVDYPLKREVLKHYSKALMCHYCSERRVPYLTLHHVNHNGREHMRILGIEGGRQFYQWLKDHDYPKECERGGKFELQVLCWNCQDLSEEKERNRRRKLPASEQ